MRRLLAGIAFLTRLPVPARLAFDAQGRLWEQEFGNSVMDETNLIERGGNYGWPACEGTSGTCGTAGFIAPKRTYPTSEGSCSGIAIVRDALYVACLRGTRLYRGVISGTSLTNVQPYFVGTYGRLRTVEPAPSGGLWLTTSNTGDKDSVPNNSNERILHVAQSLYHDIVPARALGLSTVWVNRRAGQEGSGATVPAEGQPDLEVPDLASLVRAARITAP